MKHSRYVVDRTDAEHIVVSCSCGWSRDLGSVKDQRFPGTFFAWKRHAPRVKVPRCEEIPPLTDDEIRRIWPVSGIKMLQRRR